MTARTYYVSASPFASDENTGQLAMVENKNPNGPLATIQKAIDLAQSGDIIEILAGTYLGRVRVFNKNNIHIKAHGNGEVTLQGHHQNFGKNWTFLKQITASTGNPLYIYQHPLPKEWLDTYQKINKYELAYHFLHRPDGSIFWTYPSLDLLEQATIYADKGEGIAMGRTAVYLASTQKQIPNSSYKLSLPMAFVSIVNSQNITIDGGEGQSIKLENGGEQGIVIKGQESDRGNISIKNLKILNFRTAIQIFSKGTGVEIDNCYIKNHCNPLWTWEDRKAGSYNRIKAKGLEGGLPSPAQTNGITYASATNERIKIKNNYIENTFNGIVVSGNSTDVTNNTLINIGDDAIEIEGDCENIICSDNFLKDCWRSISLCPVKKGPVYIFDNIFILTDKSHDLWYYDFDKKEFTRREARIFKIWNMPATKNGEKVIEISRNCHFYNNIFYASVLPLQGIGGGTKNLYDVEDYSFYNNIFYSDKEVGHSYFRVIKGIDMQNNLFYSADIGLENSNFDYIRKNPNKDWKINRFVSPGFVKKYPKEEKDFNRKLFSKSKRLLGFGSKSKSIPNNWPRSEEINQRNYIGAKEKE